MTVFVSDAFTDTDAVLLQDHTPDVGGAWSKRLGANDIEITSNKGNTTGADTHYYTNAATPGSADYEIEATFDRVEDATNHWGFVGRFVDSSNFYNCYYDDAFSDAYTLRKRVGGSFTTLDTQAEAWAGDHVLKFTITTAAKKGYVDDVEKVSSADDAITATGNAGIYIQNNNANITIDGYSAGDTGEPVSENASMQPIHHWWPR